MASNPTDDELYEMLQKIDPETALLTHRHNRFRILRALEIFHITGKKKSEHLMEQKFKIKGKSLPVKQLLSNLIALYLKAINLLLFNYLG